MILALGSLPALVLWRGLLALLWLLSAPVWAEVAIPPVARVTDHAAVLTPGAIQAMEGELAALEASKGSQIAVLILPTTQPETIEQYGIRVAEAWKLGRKGVDDGALLLVAKDDRTLRIEVGYGLEGVIPDAVAKRVIEEVIVPRFKAGDFEAGIGAGVTALIKLVEGEPLPPPKKSSTDGIPGLVGEVLPAAMMFVFVVGGILRALFGRLLAAGIAGGIAFLGAWMLIGSAVIAAVIAFIIFFITLAGGAGRGGYVGGGREGAASVVAASPAAGVALGAAVPPGGGERMQLGRLIKHLFYPPWLAGRAFPVQVRRRIESAIAESEVRHGGEIRFAVEASLDLMPLLRGETARERAIEVFTDLRVWDTEQNNGVLVYLLLADRDVEIVADRGLNGRVSAADWEAICQEMEAMFRRGAFEAGVLRGIDLIGGHLARHFPRPADNANELADRPVLLK